MQSDISVDDKISKTGAKGSSVQAPLTVISGGLPSTTSWRSPRTDSAGFRIIARRDRRLFSSYRVEVLTDKLGCDLSQLQT